MSAALSSSGRLAGRLAVVTGGGSGIGRAVCEAFAKQGAKVAAVDVNEKGLDETLSKLGDGHHGFVTDVSRSDDVTSLMSKINSSFTELPPSVAVNCAGIMEDAILLKHDVESFERVIDVNLKGTFLMTQAIARRMVEGNVTSGSIINISSIIAKTGNLGQCSYSASKAGIIGFSKSAAKELAKFGIRCNVILPGVVDTPRYEALPDKYKPLLIAMIPLGRIGTAEELANSCVFLASEESCYITGTCLEVTGGMSM